MNPKTAIYQTLEKALVVQVPMARKNVERLRCVHPHDTPAQLVKRLDTYYLTAVTASGGAAGAGGVVPGVGVPLALADVMAFTEASVFYVLSLAEVHDLHPDDVERRKLLLLTVLLGNSATGALSQMLERAGGYWARRIVKGIPMSAINRANSILGPRFITKYGTKQGVLVLSKQVPLGVGSLLGGAANHVVGRATVKSAHTIFGPPPKAERAF